MRALLDVNRRGAARAGISSRPPFVSSHQLCRRERVSAERLLEVLAAVALNPGSIAKP
jgi:hypothetical protein